MATETISVNLHLDPLTVNVNHVISVDKVLFALINSINTKVTNMAASVQAAIDTLTADVAAETTANQSAITLIQGFAAQLAAAVAAAQAAGATAAQLASFDSLSAAVEANTASLAAAVTAGTPAA